MATAPLDEAWCWELRKFYSANRVWRECGHRAGPIKLRSGEEWEGTYAEWFELMYGESLDAYAKRAKAENIRASVEQWEREQGVGSAANESERVARQRPNSAGGVPDGDAAGGGGGGLIAGAGQALEGRG